MNICANTLVKDPPAGADLGYLAYSLHLTWGICPAANDQAVLQIRSCRSSRGMLATGSCSSRMGV